MTDNTTPRRPRTPKSTPAAKPATPARRAMPAKKAPEVKAAEPEQGKQRTVRRTSAQRHLRAVGKGDTVDTAPPPPEPPEGMGPHGKRLWRDVVAKFEFRPDELVVLASACYAEERVHGIREELARMEILVRGSMGQMVTNPLLSEVRAHENHVAAMLAKLKLKDVESGAQQGRSEGARQAAKARWATPHGAPS